jgi:hypothetical protein
MAVLCMVGTVGVTLADTPAGGASPATGVQTGRTVGAEVRTVAGSGQLRVAVTGPTRGWVPAHIPGWARRGPGVAHRTSTGHARLSTTTVDNVLETTNWSGLIDAGTTFTGVSGKWVVPAVRPSTTTQVSSTWVGIDGFSNSSLIQTGTTQATSGGSTSYFAWYEILPADAVPIFTVQPGDVVQASVTRATSGTWTISIDDLTAREAFSHPYSFSGPRASAEWIEEAPTDGLTDKLYPLARFGTVPFSDLSVSGADTGSTYVTPVDMIDTAQDVIAYPSNFASGAFTVTRGTPPVPTASLSVDPNPATAGQNVRYSVSVRGPGGTPTGTVLFLTGDTDLCLVVLVNGQGGCVADSAPTGNDPVDALYSGDASFSAALSTTVHLAVRSSGDPSQSTLPFTAPGYDLVGRDGGVFVFGGGYYGSLPGLGVEVDDITGIVATATHTGYFLVGSDGGVFAFHAHFANSLPGIGVHVDDIVGIVPTRDDQGYFLVGRDGGVFSFNAPFANSLPGVGVHVDDITGIAATPDDNGYWLVGSDGSVYAFGDARFRGSAPAGAVAITATHDGGGYWVVGADGSVTAFGDAGTYGDLPGLGVGVDDIVGIVVSEDSKGYNLIGRDGGVFSFGDATNTGSLPGLGVSVDDIVGAVPT